MNELKLILICGLPGCGKSTIASQLSKKYKLPILSVDPIESGILESGIKRSIKTELAAYLLSANLIDRHLSLGVSIILDAVSGPKSYKDKWIALAKKHSASLVIVECTNPNMNIQLSRIKARNGGHYGIPELNKERLEEYIKSYSEWDLPKIELSSLNTIENNLNQLYQYLG